VDVTDGLTRHGPFAVSAAVITHPSRGRLVERLRRREPRLRFTLHSGPSPECSMENALASVLSAWRAVPPGATHHLVLQDDVLPADRFLDHLANAIACAPERAFSMFSEWGSKTAQTIRLAALSGHGWAAVADPWLPAPAVVMPADMARGFAEYLQVRLREGEKRDAFLLLSYLASLGSEPVVSVPNLVEHDLPLVESLLPNGKVRGPRRAACPAGRPPGPWPPGVTRLPPCLPYHSPHDLGAVILSEWDGHYGWQTTPAFSWLAERGWSLPDIDGGFRQTVARTGIDMDAAPLGADAIRESWLAAFTLGWISGDAFRGAGWTCAADLRETPAAALRSLAAGAFRRVLAPRLLDSWSDRAVPMLADAVLCGHAEGARSGAPGPPDGSA
jgi:hypothetical protein